MTMPWFDHQSQTVVMVKVRLMRRRGSGGGEVAVFLQVSNVLHTVRVRGQMSVTCAWWYIGHWHTECSSTVRLAVEKGGGGGWK